MGRWLAAAIAVSLVAGCSADPPNSEKPTAKLHVTASNESFDQPSAHIVVTVDGALVAEGDAPRQGSDRRLQGEADLSPGRHLIEAHELNSGARDTHAIELPGGDQRWVTIAFWTFDDRGAFFTFKESEEADSGG